MDTPQSTLHINFPFHLYVLEYMSSSSKSPQLLKVKKEMSNYEWEGDR